MTTSRKIVVIALGGVLLATPLLAVGACPNRTAACVRAECPLRDPICPRSPDSQEPGTGGVCHACGYTLLPFAGTMSADYPIGLQTPSIRMTAGADTTTKCLADASFGQAWPRAHRQLLLHCALLI